MIGTGPNKDQPPQDWMCIFGGSAWSPSGMDDGTFYLHTFDSSQPDWNWDHPDVVADFLKTIKFWADRGVSGFRVDVADQCKKHMNLAMRLNWKERQAITAEHKKYGSPVVDPMRDLDEILEVYKGWREVFNRYDPPITYVQRMISLITVPLLKPGYDRIEYSCTPIPRVWDSASHSISCSPPSTPMHTRRGSKGSMSGSRRHLVV
jgi:hypothetical protein